ncbi:MAG UNVERIFIED_CONTAM: hypothetical protein LVR29_17820 [Microcystis novacekii LVE1205-3]
MLSTTGDRLLTPPTNFFIVNPKFLYARIAKVETVRRGLNQVTQGKEFIGGKILLAYPSNT